MCASRRVGSRAHRAAWRVCAGSTRQRPSAPRTCASLLERRVGRRELLDEPGAALGDGPSADSLSGLPGAQHGALRRHDLLGGSLLAPPGSGQLLPGALEEPSTALGLRGVTPIGGSTHRYEVNLGHQSYGSGRVQWELWVENLGVTPLRYRVFPLTTEEGDWVSLSYLMASDDL